MSIKLMSRIWEHPELARGETFVTKDQKEVDQQNKMRTMKMVLLALADMANDDGVCWPSNETIAQRSNLTADYVRSLIGTLRVNEWLSVDPRYTATGKQTSNLITLNTERIYKPRTPDLVHPSHLVPPIGGDILPPIGGHLVGGTIDPPSYPSERNVNTPAQKTEKKATKATEPPAIPWQRTPTAKESTFAHFNARFPAKERRPVVEALIDVHGLAALIESDHPDADRKLRDFHEMACTLHEMKIGAKDIAHFAKLWKENDFRGKKGQRPENGQFLAFISQQLADRTGLPVEDPGTAPALIITDSWEA